MASQNTRPKNQPCNNLVSRGQTLFSRRGVIACSISAPREKGSGMVHRYYLFLTPPQVWGVLIDSDVDVAYVLLHLLLSKCTLLRRWQKLVHFAV